MLKKSSLQHVLEGIPKSDPLRVIAEAYVCQRYGGYGRETAPLAAQIIKKWREIRSKIS